MVDGDDLRIFDWSDACVSHPLFDLPTFLERCDDAAARERMLDAYLDVWSDTGSPTELRAAFELAQPVACAHHAISYLRITQALEPDDCWWFADAPARWRPRPLTPNTPAKVTWASAGDGAEAGSTPSLTQLAEDSGASKVPKCRGFPNLRRTLP